MKQVLTIWMQPIYARLNSSGLKALWFTLALLAIVPPTLLFYTSGIARQWYKLALAMGLGIAMALAIILIFWLIMLIPSIALQYTPANARLLPGLQSSMYWALVIPTLLVPALFTVAGNIRDPGFSTLNWLCGVIVMLFYISSLRSKWVMLVPLFVAEIFWILSKKDLIGFVDAWKYSWVLLVLGVILTAWIVKWTLAVSGDQHFKRQQGFLTMRNLMNGQELNTNRSAWQTAGTYGLQLRHCMARVRKELAPARDLQPFSFGAAAFWPGIFLSVLLTGLFLGFFYMILLDKPSAQQDHALSYFAILLALCLLPFAYSAGAHHAVSVTRTEQALVSLAARLPDLEQQSRNQLKFLLRQFFMMWVATLLVLVTVLYFAPVEGLISESFVIAFFSTLPLSLVSLKNHALTKSRYEFGLLSVYALSPVLIAALIFLRVQLSQWPAWVICITVLLLTSLVLRWRWKQLMQLRVVFPVGRAV